jgi:hypothetical protein
VLPMRVLLSIHVFYLSKISILTPFNTSKYNCTYSLRPTENVGWVNLQKHPGRIPNITLRPRPFLPPPPFSGSDESSKEVQGRLRRFIEKKHNVHIREIWHRDGLSESWETCFKQVTMRSQLFRNLWKNFSCTYS